MRARLLLLVVRLPEGFVAPSPPGSFALDVKQEFRHWPSIRCAQMRCFPDTAVRGLPQAGNVIDDVQQPEFVLEQRADVIKPGRRPDLGREPGKSPPVTTSSARSSSPPTSRHTLPGSLTGPILPSASVSAREPSAECSTLSPIGEGSGSARDEDVEFVALRVGQTRPRDVALAEVDLGGAECSQPAEKLEIRPVGCGSMSAWGH